MLVVEIKCDCKTMFPTFKKKLTFKERDKRLEATLKKHL